MYLFPMMLDEFMLDMRPLLPFVEEATHPSRNDTPRLTLSHLLIEHQGSMAQRRYALLRECEGSTWSGRPPPTVIKRVVKGNLRIHARLQYLHTTSICSGASTLRL